MVSRYPCPDYPCRQDDQRVRNSYSLDMDMNTNILGSFWKRIIPTATPGMQQRFRETLDFFFQAITQQAKDREAGVVPDLESYITVRRDTR